MSTEFLKPEPGRTRRQAVCEAIEQLADEVGPSGKLPTVRQMCARFGVSPVTLDRALSELEQRDVLVREHGRGIYASPRLRQKVIGILIGMDLSRVRRSRVPDMMLYYYQQLIDTDPQQRYLMETFIDSPLSGTNRPVRRYLEQRLASGQIAGVILMHASGREQLQWLRRQNVPFAYTYSRPNDVRPDANAIVEMDSCDLIRQGIGAVLDQGAKRIGIMYHINRRLVPGNDDPRGDLFRSALAANSLTADEHWCQRVIWSDDYSFDPVNPTLEERAYTRVKELLDQNIPLPDALVIDDDTLAFGTLMALERAGVQVGRDILIATQTNIDSPVLMPWADRLIHLEYDLKAVAQVTYDGLSAIIENGDHPARPQLIRASLRIGQELTTMR